MKRTDKLRYIEMPIPNPDNEYANYANQLRPALHIDSEELRALYEEKRIKLFQLLELQMEMLFGNPRIWKRWTFPSMQDMTGEWYIGELTLYEERKPFSGPAGDPEADGERKIVYGSVLTRFLGRNPSRDRQNPILDYLGIEFFFRYDAEPDNFTFDLRRACRLYMELPEFFEANVPKDSVLCPSCHATKVDVKKYRQAVAAGKSIMYWRSVACPVCGGFGYVSPQGERISTRARLNASGRNFFRLVFLPAFLPALSLVAAFLLLYLVLHPAVLGWLTAGAQSALDLLAGYSRWYLLLLAAVAGAPLVILTGGAVSLRHAFSLRSFRCVTYPLRATSVFMVALFLMLYGTFAAIMITSEEVPVLWRQSREDIAQIESGELEQVTVWLSPKLRSSRLPGPYTEGQPEPVTRYGGVSEETGFQWIHFYVPDCLGFSLDQDALFDENESIAWNEAHARQYQITYTANLHVAVSVLPVDLDAASSL